MQFQTHRQVASRVKELSYNGLTTAWLLALHPHPHLKKKTSSMTLILQIPMAAVPSLPSGLFPAFDPPVLSFLPGKFCPSVWGPNSPLVLLLLWLFFCVLFLRLLLSRALWTLACPESPARAHRWAECDLFLWELAHSHWCQLFSLWWWGPAYVSGHHLFL